MNRNRIVYICAAISLALSGAIFGFFYAYSASVMRGLDFVDATVAIPAMQGINATVRNAVFAPAFFGTPVALLLTSLMAFAIRRRAASGLFLMAAILYIGGAFLPTLVVNVPMNDALAGITPPSDTLEAERIWRDYSDPWQLWNHIRAAFSGFALLVAGGGIWYLRLGPSLSGVRQLEAKSPLGDHSAMKR